MKIGTRTEQIIDVQDWDDLVKETYGKTYCYQQQDGCKERGRDYITVPVKRPFDYKNDSLPEEINHEEMGVSFKAWLERDPKQPLNSPDGGKSWGLDMWWERNFYPHVDMIINDLHAKGFLEKGEYVIDIDW